MALNNHLVTDTRLNHYHLTLVLSEAIRVDLDASKLPVHTGYVLFTLELPLDTHDKEFSS